MNEQNTGIQDVLDILTGKKKVGAEVVTSVDKSYDILILRFWIYALISFTIGIFIYKYVLKK